MRFARFPNTGAGGLLGWDRQAKNMGELTTTYAAAGPPRTEADLPPRFQVPAATRCHIAQCTAKEACLAYNSFSDPDDKLAAP